MLCDDAESWNTELAILMMYLACAVVRITFLANHIHSVSQLGLGQICIGSCSCLSYGQSISPLQADFGKVYPYTVTGKAWDCAAANSWSTNLWKILIFGDNIRSKVIHGNQHCTWCRQDNTLPVMFLIGSELVTFEVKRAVVTACNRYLLCLQHICMYAPHIWFSWWIE